MRTPPLRRFARLLNVPMAEPRSLCAVCRNETMFALLRPESCAIHRVRFAIVVCSPQKGSKVGMKVQVRAERPAQIKADAIALGVFPDGKPSSGFAAIDSSLSGILTDMRRSGELRGREGEVHVIRAGKRSGAKRIIVIGVGDRANIHSSSFAKLAGL